MSAPAVGRGPGGAGLGLTFVEGRGVLTIEGRALAAAGRVDKLEMEIPNLRFPFDLSGGIAKFQNRRCHLRELTLSSGQSELAALVRALPLATYGIYDLQVEVEGGLLRLSARAAYGKREAQFTAVAVLRRTGSRQVRLALFDLRVYGFLPVPAPLVGVALFTAASARVEAAGIAGAPDLPPLVGLGGPTDLDLELVDLALLGLLPPSGWRMPECEGVELTALGGDPDRLSIRYRHRSGPPSGGEFPPVASPALAAGIADHDRGSRQFTDAEAALVVSDLPRALHLYHRAAKNDPDDRFAATRLLQMLCASAASLTEADDWADVLLDRWSDFIPALTAKATVAAEQGRPVESARLFERLAELSGATGCPADRAAALVAAAEQRLRAGETEAATRTLEEVVAERPAHPGALRALAQRLAEQERWPDLLRILRQRAAFQPESAGRAALYAQIGFVYLDNLKDVARARDRFEQAARLHEGAAIAWEGLGRTQRMAGEPGKAALSLQRAKALFAGVGDRAGEARALVALAELDADVGNVDGAIEKLRYAAQMDVEAWQPLRRAAEVALAAGRHSEALSLLEGAAARAPAARDRAACLRRMANVQAAVFSDSVAARMLLERILADDPGDLGALDDLAALLESRGDLDEAEALLRRALDGTRAPPDRRRLLARLCDVARATKNHGLLGEMLARLAAEGGGQGARASLDLADLAETLNDADLVARAARLLESFLVRTDEPLQEPSSATLSRRLADLCIRQGADDEAVRWLHLCLESDAQGSVAASAWRSLVALAEARQDAAAVVEILIRWADDVRTGEDGGQRARHLLAAADLLAEGLARPEAAVVLLERAMTLDGADGDVFAAFERVATQAKDWPRLAAALRQRLAMGVAGQTAPHLDRLGQILAVEMDLPDEAEAVYRRLLALEPDHPAGNLWSARLAWRGGNLDDGARCYERVVAAVGPGVAATARAEASLRLAQWARVVGRTAEAEHHLVCGLEAEPDVDAGAPLDVLLEVVEGFGRTDQLLDLLRQRRQSTQDPGQVAATDWALAGVLERVGRSAEAVEIYRRRLDDAPTDREPLYRLAEIFRRESRPAELGATLERLLSGAPDSEAEVVGLELAGLFRDALGQPARAEGLLRRLLERSGSAVELLELLSELLWARGAFEEADAVLARRVAVDGGGTATQLLMDRVRLRLSSPGGERQALGLLRGFEPAQLTVEGLAKRAELAEACGEAADALACLRQLRASDRVAADSAAVAALHHRILALVGKSGIEIALGIEALEELLACNAADPELADALVRAYGQLADVRARNRALTALLSRAPGLTSVHRAHIHAVLGETAARDGDLTLAESQYRAALSFAVNTARRADILVEHARVLMALKATEDVAADLDEALAVQPDHPAALLLTGEHAQRAEDWGRALRAYDKLAGLARAGEVIPAGVLAFRIALLADRLGDKAAAETAYARAAALDGSHLDAREALARLAGQREDLPGAARWLEEAVALYGPDAVAKASDARQLLGDIRFRLGEHAAARRHLELVLADDPERVAALEILVRVYDTLRLPREAAGVFGRLARLYAEPPRRAEALYQQGEIFRLALGDDSAASDAYLRSSDADPSFAPTLRRLVHHYWGQGDFANLAEVGAAVVSQGSPDQQAADDLGVLIAMGVALGSGDGVLARAALAPAWLASPPLTAERCAARLAELGDRSLRKSPDALDPALAVLTGGGPPGFAADLAHALCARVLADPSSRGALIALGRLGELRGDRAVARAAYGLLSFLDPDCPVNDRLAELGLAAAPVAAAVALGAFEHPACTGPTRRVMAAVAHALAGFPASGAAAPAGQPPAATVVDLIDGVRRILGAAPVSVIVRADAADLAVEGRNPPVIVLGEKTVELPRAELTFLAARAVEDCRAGSFALVNLSPGTLADFLAGLLTAVEGAAPVTPPANLGPIGVSLVSWLAQPGPAARLPEGKDRRHLAADLRDAVASPPDLGRYLLGCRYSADRLGLLLSGSPRAALRATAGSQRPVSDARFDPRAIPALRELIGYLFSAEYRDAVGGGG